MSKFSDYKTFSVIVESLTLTEAANRLHRSVSAVSKQLTKLEQSLGVQLIDRSTHSLSVTEIGNSFYLKCKKILYAIEDTEQQIKDGMVTPSGKIHLSFPEVMLRMGLMDMLSVFHQEYPEIIFDFKVSNQLDNVIEEQIDFSFRFGQLTDSRLTAFKLTETDFVICATNQYITQYGRPETIDSMFLTHKMLLPSYVNLSEKIRVLLSPTCTLPIKLDSVHTSTSEAVIYQAVLRSMGIAILLKKSIVSDLKRGNLVELFPKVELKKQAIHLVYHQRDYLPQKMKLFKQFVKDNSGRYLAEVV